MRDESKLPARKLLFRKWRAQAVADARYTGQIARSVKLQMRLFVCAAPGGVPVLHARVSEQARENTSSCKTNVTSKSPVGDISVDTQIMTDTRLVITYKT